MTSTQHQDPTAIHAVPTQDSPQGLRLLVLRQFQEPGTPPAFAFIDQHLLRTPGRSTRHGLFFAPAFRVETMDWLIARLGRPSLRSGNGPAARNPRWPVLNWTSAARHWPDGTRTIEWTIDIAFPEADFAAAFRDRWRTPPDSAG
jgi:hypothetical protein